MMNLKSIERLASKLFEDLETQAAFVDEFKSPRPQPALLWTTPRPEHAMFETQMPEPWQPAFADRLSLESKPGKHPLHDIGAYYALEFSSVFEAAVTMALPKLAAPMLDLCAAPGGKTVFLSLAHSPTVLLANEAIGSRRAPLTSNLKRCKTPNAYVSSLDPEFLAEALPEAFALTLVDAPCSGQSLILKGISNPGCFHPLNVNRNANRQRRIIAQAAHTVAPGGFLAYMTCTYSKEENESIIEWFLKQFPEFEALTVEPLEAYRSALSKTPCYRLWPFQGLGVGGFTALLAKRGTLQVGIPDLTKVRSVGKITH